MNRLRVYNLGWFDAGAVGDGLVDVITSRPDNTVTFINQRKQATKLSSITNGFGIQTQLEEKKSTEIPLVAASERGTALKHIFN